MAKQIFYVMSCDEWKSTDSMQLVFIGTSQQKLKMYVSKLIEKGDMEYKFDCDDEPTEQDRIRMAREFRADWSARDGISISNRRDINDHLYYGYIDYCYDNDPNSI